jgi:L,D-peptidoglycan transpeptidase YkuD (ErfK/YbiS/YcfS/YnhG family)
MSEAIVYPDGRLVMQGRTWRCALGRGGVRADKQEGDMATPVGLLPLRRVLYRADRGAIPGCAVPREPIGPDDGWCEDPAHPDYNRPVRLPHPSCRDRLWREDSLYDLIGVLGWNDDPVTPGRGSAIFLHGARPDYGPTAGCVALALPDVRAILELGLTTIRVLGP